MPTTLTAEDRFEIIEQTNRIFLFCDRHEWDRMGEVFTDPLLLDYTALLGGTPKTISPKQLGVDWHGELGGLDHSQHLLTNHIIEATEDGAHCIANIHSTHIFDNSGGDTRYFVGGRYEFGLKRTERGWLVASQKVTPIYATGNVGVLQLAAEKVKRG